ncbi:Antitoxin YefM [compost metagenome]
MPAIITRQRGEHVVMMSLDDYNALNETVYLLGTEANAKHLRESIAQLRAGSVRTMELPDNVTAVETP